MRRAGGPATKRFNFKIFHMPFSGERGCTSSDMRLDRISGLCRYGGNDLPGVCIHNQDLVADDDVIEALILRNNCHDGRG